MSEFNYKEAHDSRLRGTFISFMAVGIGGFAYIIFEVIKDSREFESKSLEREIKQSVLEYADKDSNGLSFFEDYKIKELMEIEDSSKNYVPCFEDWERAYNKIKD
jgi:hypothetical protein